MCGLIIRYKNSSTFLQRDGISTNFKMKILKITVFLISKLWGMILTDLATRGYDTGFILETFQTDILGNL